MANNRRKRKINTKIKIIILLLILLIITVCLPIGITLGRKWFSPILLYENTLTIEINETIDFKTNIEHVKDGEIEDVIIDDSKVDFTKLGDYPLVYTIGENRKEITVHIVDTKAPSFKTVDIELCENYEIDPNELVSDIKDATKTKVYLKENVTLKANEHIKVIVVVEDEAGNTKEKSASIKVLPKDETAPVVEAGDLRVTVNNKIDYMEGLSIKDDYDKNPKVEIDDSQVDLTKPGTYEIIYTVSDKAKNTTTFTRMLNVVKNYPASIGEAEEKIVYLTFDDGPSHNTGEILDILKKYKVTATFFVTGTRPEYNHMIKRAFEEGHTIGLHTYSHDYATVYSSPEAYFNDLYAVGNMVEKLTGKFPRFIRFPGGASNTTSANYCPGIMTYLTQEVINRGFQYYDWNADSTDASGNNVPVSQIIANATAYQNNNLNILFHDTDAKDTTVEALPAIIEYYQSHGYKIKGIDNKSFTPHHGVNN